MLKTRKVSPAGYEKKVMLTALAGLDYIDYLDYLSEQSAPESPKFNLPDNPTQQEQDNAQKLLKKFQNKIALFHFQVRARLVAYGVYRNPEFDEQRRSAVDDEDAINKVHHYVMRNYHGSVVKELYDAMCDLCGMKTPEQMDEESKGDGSTNSEDIDPKR